MTYLNAYVEHNQQIYQCPMDGTGDSQKNYFATLKTSYEYTVPIAVVFYGISTPTPTEEQLEGAANKGSSEIPDCHGFRRHLRRCEHTGSEFPVRGWHVATEEVASRGRDSLP